MNRRQASPRRAKAYTTLPNLTWFDPAEPHLTIPFILSLPASPALPTSSPHLSLLPPAAMGLEDCLHVVWPKAKVWLDSANLGEQ